MSDIGSCTVITVSYNSRETLERNVLQWKAFPRLIVVDNASVDSTAEWVRGTLPECRLFINSTNIGYGRANNLALQKVDTPYALLLNPDCQLPLTSLREMLACANRHPEIALIGPRYVDIGGKTLEACRVFFNKKNRRKMRYVDPVGDLCTDFVTGAALLVNVARVSELQGFDRWFFLYCEDEELAWRVRHAGLPVMVAAAAKAVHSPMRSSTAGAGLHFVRHYCHTLSKLRLRRCVGQSRWRVFSYGMLVLSGAVLLLPFRLLGFSWPRAVREVARIAAIVTAPIQLSLAECQPTPARLAAYLCRRLRRWGGGSGSGSSE